MKFNLATMGGITVITLCVGGCQLTYIILHHFVKCEWIATKFEIAIPRYGTVVLRNSAKPVILRTIYDVS